jgi:hypothetical protein
MNMNMSAGARVHGHVHGLVGCVAAMFMAHGTWPPMKDVGLWMGGINDGPAVAHEHET